jgi:2'-5' RNA ligase
MKIRCFIAVNLPEEIKDYLAEVITDIKRKFNFKNVKWVERENLHFTLHFLGSQDEKETQKIENILLEETKNSSSTEVEIKNLSAFPDMEKARVFFVSCKEIGGDKLKELQERIGKSLKKIGYKIDERTWQIHITLARFRKPFKITHLKQYPLKPLRFKVKSIDLMKSELTSSGPKYFLIKKFPLNPSL